MIDHLAQRVLIGLLIHQERRHILPPTGGGNIAQRVLFAVRRPLPPERMPQTLPWPLDTSQAIGPLQPVARMLPADRCRPVVLHWEDERAADRRMLLPILEQGCRCPRRHRR